MQTKCTMIFDSARVAMSPSSKSKAKNNDRRSLLHMSRSLHYYTISEPIGKRDSACRPGNIEFDQP